MRRPGLSVCDSMAIGLRQLTISICDGLIGYQASRVADVSLGDMASEIERANVDLHAARPQIDGSIG